MTGAMWEVKPKIDAGDHEQYDPPEVVGIAFGECLTRERGWVGDFEEESEIIVLICVVVRI